ncbi:MAG: (2Fe-2S)-binding protein, partial [Gammaproteobacteria bacterium]|nr:(2Fe-2S)-binding protein [Gammaproteobacteria bacterium]
GQLLEVRENLTLAAALLEARITEFCQTPVSGSPRSPFCMMGVCFDCLVIVDGLPNQQACLTPVREGMRVERQSGAADILHISDDTAKVPS